MEKIENQNQAEMLEKQKQEALKNIRKTAEEAAQGKAQEIVNEKLNEVVSKFENVTTKEEVETLKTDFYKQVQEMQAKLKEVKQTKLTPTTFKNSQEALVSAFKNAFFEHKDKITKYQGGDLVLPVTKEADTPDDSISIDSFGVGGYADLTSQNLGLDINPFAPVYLRNIFPNVTTGGSNVTIWKRKAAKGSAAVWNRKDTEGEIVHKPKVTGEWEKEVVSVEWIPAYTIIDREVLEDVDFMASEIPQLLIYGESGILRAENKMILDYITANAVDYTLPTGFDDFDNSLEAILAAAFGQMGDRFLTPTHILISNWDYLKYLAFNKSNGSGVYTYPNMTLSFINNRPFINGLQAVPNPDIPIGEAYVIAAARSRFVSRQGIRQRISDSHAEIFTTNQVAYLAESRGAFFTYDNNSFVKVELPTPAVVDNGTSGT